MLAGGGGRGGGGPGGVIPPPPGVVRVGLGMICDAVGTSCCRNGLNGHWVAPHEGQSILPAIGQSPSAGHQEVSFIRAILLEVAIYLQSARNVNHRTAFKPCG